MKGNGPLYTKAMLCVSFYRPFLFPALHFPWADVTVLVIAAFRVYPKKNNPVLEAGGSVVSVSL